MYSYSLRLRDNNNNNDNKEEEEEYYSYPPTSAPQDYEPRTESTRLLAGASKRTTLYTKKPKPRAASFAVLPTSIVNLWNENNKQVKEEQVETTSTRTTAMPPPPPAQSPRHCDRSPSPSPPPPPPPHDKAPTNVKECLLWCWYRSFHDCCTFRRPPHLKDQPIHIWKNGFLVAFATKLLLEVAGAGGAVWGFSEVLGLRNNNSANNHDNNNNNTLFRTLALAIAALFLVRFYWHAKHWLEHEHDFPYPKLDHRRQHVIHFFQVFCAKWLLQVAGAAGAVWGASEAAGFRVSSATNNNNDAWQLAAIVTGAVFLGRWILEILSYCLVFGNDDNDDYDDDDDTHNSTLRRHHETLEIYLLPWTGLIVKFVLEVCGAVGAVWGFSEIIYLRTSDNSTRVWRPIALAVGVVFGMRWMKQVWTLGRKQEEAPLVTEPMVFQKQHAVRRESSLRRRMTLRKSAPASFAAAAAAAATLALSDLALVEEGNNDNDKNNNRNSSVTFAGDDDDCPDNQIVLPTSTTDVTTEHSSSPAQHSCESSDG